MHYLHVAHQQLNSAAGGKEVIVSETGWPSAGNPVGDAIPSPDNASFYFRNFVSWARADQVKYFYFEAYDEPWKATPPAQPQEAHWGSVDYGRRAEAGHDSGLQRRNHARQLDEPASRRPFIHFPTLPYHTDTNLPDFVVASFTDPNDQVLFNGVPLPPGAGCPGQLRLHCTAYRGQ